jgi:glucosamine-6-phosphate deaminase
MKVLVVKDYDSMSKEAGHIFIEAIKNKPNIVLGLATGSTPIGMYKEMIKAHKEEGLDFSKVVTFNLDEYVGLTKDHPSSYR